MKLLVLIKSSTDSGGLETQNQLLVEGLRKHGHEVEVVKTKSPFGDPPEAGIGSADVVISQSAAGTKFLLSRKGRKPPVVVIQHGTLWGSLKTKLRIDGFSPRLISYTIKAYILDLLRLHRCEAIIAVSEKVRKDLVSEYFLPPEKIKVIYNGVKAEKFANQQLIDSKNRRLDRTINNRKTILYLGRLAKEKGLDVLLQAFQETIQPFSHLTIQLLIVGSGPAFDPLNNRTEELGLTSAVKFIGKVPYENVPKYYQEADVFVYPSEAVEGLPMSVIEAMAAGLPVVASRIGGIPEAVIDGETGLLVKSGNVDELSTALSKLLMDDELRKKMGQRAREVAKEKFSQETMILETLKVLESVAR